MLPESSWFEAWGTALLVRDSPSEMSPKIAAQPGLGRLPPLHLYGERVQVIPAPPRQAPPDGPLVLGVDAGSTTTKAILLDPSTHAVVASYYGRTKGNPVAATRECLQALIDQVGNRQIGLIGTTGSARELAGAYLGTEHVYNEISAHAAGATHFDPDVDTIFEIGGQDSKYIYLRNGVPIDYAMNNACSAGTGSFLEESAHSDLGITVSDIADLALAAPSPVHFKATCAAFINSDIRLAQQQGHPRDNIIAGLVYAIADNYLNRVKGPRYVGKKIFLQGGVALNRAVGYAFAHSVGRQVVIPPSPELLGALGVGLLALKRSDAVAGPYRRSAHPRRTGDEARRPIYVRGLQDVLQHRPVRGRRTPVSFRRPLQPVRECVEAKGPDRSGSRPGRKARRGALSSHARSARLDAEARASGTHLLGRRARL